MNSGEVRDWLGIYVLLLVAFLGGYLFLAPPMLLPLESGDKTSAFEIIIPFLLAQLAAVYRFYSDPHVSERTRIRSIPRWVIKGPPVVVSLLLISELGIFAYAGINRQTPPTADTFKGLITFCVALLNASTIFVITRYFDVGRDAAAVQAGTVANS